jgi:hypothetical protein
MCTACYGPPPIASAEGGPQAGEGQFRGEEVSAFDNRPRTKDHFPLGGTPTSRLLALWRLP